MTFLQENQPIHVVLTCETFILSYMNLVKVDQNHYKIISEMHEDDNSR